MQFIVNNLKSLGYVLTIPLVAGITVYFMDKSIDIQKEKNEVLKEQNEVLKQEIEFRKAASYSGAHLELDSQKKIYEEKLEKINKEILETRLKLEELTKDNQKKKETLKKLHALLLQKELLIKESAYYLSMYLENNDNEGYLKKTIETLRLKNSDQELTIKNLQLERKEDIKKIAEIKESILKYRSYSEEEIRKCRILSENKSYTDSYGYCLSVMEENKRMRSLARESILEIDVQNVSGSRIDTIQYLKGHDEFISFYVFDSYSNTLKEYDVVDQNYLKLIFRRRKGFVFIGHHKKQYNSAALEMYLEHFVKGIQHKNRIPSISVVRRNLRYLSIIEIE